MSNTLVVLSEPSGIVNTYVQSSLINSINDESVEVLDISKDELVSNSVRLLDHNDRIIFQFPMYWYSCPSEMKSWIDSVMKYDYLNRWRNKSFGIVLIAGVAKHEYSREGREKFSIEELMYPFVALAHRFGWSYEGTLSIHQFRKLSESDKFNVIQSYNHYLTDHHFNNIVSISQNKS